MHYYPEYDTEQEQAQKEQEAVGQLEFVLMADKVKGKFIPPTQWDEEEHNFPTTELKTVLDQLNELLGVFFRDKVLDSTAPEDNQLFTDITHRTFSRIPTHRRAQTQNQKRRGCCHNPRKNVEMMVVSLCFTGILGLIFVSMFQDLFPSTAYTITMVLSAFLSVVTAIILYFHMKRTKIYIQTNVVAKAQALVQKLQQELFDKNGAELEVCPLWSYVRITFVWKYALILKSKKLPGFSPLMEEIRKVNEPLADAIDGILQIYEVIDNTSRSQNNLANSGTSQTNEIDNKTEHELPQKKPTQILGHSLQITLPGNKSQKTLIEGPEDKPLKAQSMFP